MTTETAAFAVLSRDVQQHGKVLERIEAQGNSTHRLVEENERRVLSLERAGAEIAARLRTLEQAMREREERERAELEAKKMVVGYGTWFIGLLLVALSMWSGKAQSFLETLRGFLGGKH